MPSFLFTDAHFIANDQPNIRKNSTWTITVYLINICNILFFHKIIVNVPHIAKFYSLIIKRRIVNVSLKPSFFHVINFKIFQSLLKYFTSTMDMVLFQSLLLWIDRLLHHWHATSFCFIDSTRFSFLTWWN